MRLQTKIVIGVLVIAGAIGYVAYLGASSSWRYYVLVDECTADADRLRGARIRVSGTVVAGSLTVSDNRRQARFRMRGKESEVPVAVTGPLPDNLEEEMDIVVEGKLGADGRIHGDRVITRCASKYAPKNTSASIHDAKPAR